VLRTDELEYHLPEELIARVPAQPRDSARLLIVRGGDADRLEHRTVAELPDVLRAGDVLTYNTTRVLPARLQGRRADSGGNVGGLFVSEVAAGRWLVMLKATGTLRAGCRVVLAGPDGGTGGVALVLVERAGGPWICNVRLEDPDAAVPPAAALLERLGATPLPPYILGARKHAGDEWNDSLDRAWYQTVYAGQQAGSVAAPTAGLHFTSGLLERLSHRGVQRADVVLHVGLGTFKPVETEFVEQHPMHEEWFSVPGEAIGSLRRARAEGRRVIAVGTTSARALESLPDYAIAGADEAGAVSGSTCLMITPGHRFCWVNGLLTNFHLPRSTLLALVAALLPGGVPALRRIYATAVAERYRFYSYGDAMLILP
jgi:S-adenosylmethionine:tRNA ribosyltransferase-isomerase